jgi:transposase InsO family protein
MYGSYKPGEYIVVDLKHMPKSINGDEYLCTFTCLSTRLSESVYLKTRLSSEFFEHYKNYCKHIRNKTGKYPLYLHTDNGKEFIEKCTSVFNKQKGITHTFTSPHSSLQNPVAERINRTLGEGCLALLLCAGLPLMFWIYAITFFSFVKARTPHKSLSFSNPLSSWNIFNTHRTSIDLYDLRIFGSEAYVLDENSLKNNPKAFRCIYLGPSLTHKGSNFYNLYTKKVITSRNFVINEQCFPGRVHFPNIYDKYFGPSPPQPDSVSLSLPLSTPTDANGLQYSTLFEFDNNTAPVSTTIIPVTTSINLTTTTNTTTTATTTISDDAESKTNDIRDLADHIDVENYVELDETSLYVFDRNIHSKVGYGDMPSLEPATPRPLPTTPPADAPLSQPPSSPSISPAAADAADTLAELYEIDSIIGRRLTKFGKTKGGRWKHGGQTHDYEVLWSTGEKTFEPESTLKTTHADEIEAFNLQHQPSTESNFQPDVTLPGAPLSSSSFANFRNFVHVRFFCHLVKLLPVYNTSWKDIIVPEHRNQMLRSPEKEQWLAGERKELDQIAAKDTWRKVKRPKKKPISCRWVYKLKPPTTLNPKPIFKCRLVAHGYKQKANIDYSSTFAQVATLKAFRIMMWLSVFLGLRATQMDVKNAFLAGTLDAEIYMTAPPGYEQEIGTVLLVKSLYGLKQAPRIWYNTLVCKLHSLGFKELVSDSCVFVHHTEKCYILVFVDDIILYTKNEPFRTKIEQGMKTFFDIKILGTLRLFIGLQIDTDKDGNVHIHQHDYIQKLRDVFSKYFTGYFNKVNCPCDSNVKFSRSQQPSGAAEQKKMSYIPYRQLIGSLLYLLGTRPELYFIIISLSRFVQNPGYLHWLAALRVLYYVCNTPLFGLFIKVGQQFKLSVYVDSDHGGNVDDRKSISGYIIYLGSTPIIWRSKQQKGKPAESSCEAEYIALSACINEVVWIIAFLTELGFNLPTPVPIYCDNKSAKDLAHNPVHHERTKHIDIRYHRIREFILDGTIALFYVKSEDNPADIFTKSVSISTFKHIITIVYGKFVSKFAT